MSSAKKLIAIKGSERFERLGARRVGMSLEHPLYGDFEAFQWCCTQ